MIRIALCDDEDLFRTGLKQLIERYRDIHNVEVLIHEYSDGEELLNHYNCSYDIIYLDIKMNTVNGIDTAIEIRRVDNRVHIIFITSMIQYALEGYQVHAFDYILKPVSYKKIEGTLSRVVQLMKSEQYDYIIIKNDDGVHKIGLNHLIYAETYGRNLLLHTIYKQVISYDKMKTLEIYLKDKYFYRCHTSFMINFKFIEEVKKTDIVLTTSEIIPISRQKKKELLDALAQYWGDCL